MLDFTSPPLGMVPKRAQESFFSITKFTTTGAGPMAQWLSSCAPLQAAQCFVGSNPGGGHGTGKNKIFKKKNLPPQSNYMLASGLLFLGGPYRLADFGDNLSPSPPPHLEP